jgi:hypothetical protein
MIDSILSNQRPYPHYIIILQVYPSVFYTALMGESSSGEDAMAIRRLSNV